VKRRAKRSGNAKGSGSSSEAFFSGAHESTEARQLEDGEFRAKTLRWRRSAREEKPEYIKLFRGVRG
jgi:hypothetical protein